MAVILASVDRTAKPVTVESIQATNLLAEVSYNVYFLGLILIEFSSQLWCYRRLRWNVVSPVSQRTQLNRSDLAEGVETLIEPSPPRYKDVDRG